MKQMVKTRIRDLYRSIKKFKVYYPRIKSKIWVMIICLPIPTIF